MLVRWSTRRYDVGFALQLRSSQLHVKISDVRDCCRGLKTSKKNLNILPLLSGTVRDSRLCAECDNYLKAFAKLDKDRDGFLSSVEAQPRLQKAVGNSLIESQLGHLWKLADIDGDGRLTREEVRRKKYRMCAVCF